MYKVNDLHDYLGAIKRVYSNAVINKVGNFDDVCFGYEVVPEVNEIIQIKIETDNQTKCYISRFHVFPDTLTPTIYSHKIYSGAIPAGDDGPDFEFIEKILKNYKLFG